VSYDQASSRALWNGLCHSQFLTELNSTIRKYEQSDDSPSRHPASQDLACTPSIDDNSEDTETEHNAALRLPATTTTQQAEQEIAAKQGYNSIPASPGSQSLLCDLNSSLTNVINTT